MRYGDAASNPEVYRAYRVIEPWVRSHQPTILYNLMFDLREHDVRHVLAAVIILMQEEWAYNNQIDAPGN